MSYFSLNNINKKFKNINACDSISFELEKGETIVVCGESGSGKSTLLNIIAGFLVPDSGSMFLDNKLIFSDNNFIKSNKRDISLLFQNYSLFPNMTILENLKYAQKNKINLEELLSSVSILDLKDRYPHQISGGQMQRAALARALAADPKLLLMDEPFSSLDNTTKEEIRFNFKKIIKANYKTTIIVSHDVQDAYSLADKVLVLKDGKIVDKGTAQNIYSNPSSTYSAKLFGKINILNKKELKYLINSDFSGELFGIRPENIVAEENGEWKCIDIKHFGNSTFNHLILNDLKIVIKADNLALNNNYNININKNDIIRLK